MSHFRFLVIRTVIWRRFYPCDVTAPSTVVTKVCQRGSQMSQRDPAFSFTKHNKNNIIRFVWISDEAVLLDVNELIKFTIILYNYSVGAVISVVYYYISDFWAWPLNSTDLFFGSVSATDWSVRFESTALKTPAAEIEEIFHEEVFQNETVIFGVAHFE